jgi:hypothetical protein
VVKILTNHEKRAPGKHIQTPNINILQKKPITKQETEKKNKDSTKSYLTQYSHQGQSDLIYKTQTYPKGSRRLCFIRMKPAHESSPVTNFPRKNGEACTKIAK